MIHVPGGLESLLTRAAEAKARTRAAKRMVPGVRKKTRLVDWYAKFVKSLDLSRFRVQDHSTNSQSSTRRKVLYYMCQSPGGGGASRLIPH